jgi:drug/metabolite transporter (DMT)-like permease
MCRGRDFRHRSWGERAPGGEPRGGEPRGSGKAGFITGLYVVLVPLTGLLWGQRAGAGRWIGAVVAVVGLFLLSVGESLTVDRGDLLVLLSAVFWTAHVQLLGWLSPRVDPLELSAVQFFLCSLLSLAVAAVAEPFVLSATLKAASPILYGGVGSVGVAYTLQVVAQKNAHPAHAAILLSLESVFAVLGGWVLLGERLGARGLLGCGLMLAGMLISQASSLRNPALRRAEADGSQGAQPKAPGGGSTPRGDCRSGSKSSI